MISYEIYGQKDGSLCGSYVFSYNFHSDIEVPKRSMLILYNLIDFPYFSFSADLANKQLI